MLMGDTVEHAGAASESRDAWLSFVRQRQVIVGCIDARGSKSQTHRTSAVLAREVESAHRAISLLKQQQNQLLPISQLPVELLLRVFMELNKETVTDPARPSPSPPSLTVTHVCRTWRSVALDCASLWTLVPLKLGEQCAQAYVARSKSATLSLPVIRDLPDSSWQHRLVCSQASRIENLEIVHYTITSALLILNSCIPQRLVKLTLQPFTQFALGPGTWELISRIPNLQDISFANISMPWGALPWASLRSVKIAIGSNSTTEDFPLLVSCLKLAGALEVLDLNFFFCRNPESTPAKTDVAHLARLRSLTFQGFLVHFQYFTDAVTTPPAASLTVFLWPELAAGTIDTSVFIPLLRARGDQSLQSTSTHIHAMRLSTDGVSAYTARMETWQANGSSAGPRGDPCIDISLRLSNPADRRTDRELTALCGAVGLGSLRELDFSLNATLGDDWTAETFRTLFASARRVERVRIAGRHISQFLCALGPPRGDAARRRKAGTTPAEVVLPSLSHLYLQEFDETMFIVPNGVACSTFLDSRVGPLFHWISARVAHALIKVLGISDCIICDATIRALKGIAGLEVEWDESNVELADEEEDESDCGDCGVSGCPNCDY